MKFLGEQFGLEIVDRGDGHMLLQLQSEDDGTWFDIGESFSSFWLGDLEKILAATIAYIEANHKKDPDGFGYMMKRKK